MRVVVTDAEQRSALAVARSLGRAGHEVHLCGSTARPLAGASRYAASTSILANPLSEPRVYARDLAEVIQTRQAAMLLPMTDASILSVLENQSLFNSVKLPFPLDGSFQQLCDKAAVLKRGTELGIAIPTQVVLNSADDASALSLPFPVVLKPARSVTGDGPSKVKQIVSYAASPAELAEKLRACGPEAFPMLAQQRVVGPGVGVFVLIWKSQVMASFSHRRLREKPPSGGVCVLGESRQMDAELLRKSVELVRSFNWQGVAMIEYKRDEATGVDYLMEVNPRFWGSLQLAINAGVDFPRVLVALMNGDTIEPETRYRAGVRLRWFWGDVDNLIARIRRRDKFDVDSRTGRAPTNAFAAFLSAFVDGTREEVFSASDLRPFGRESLQWLRHR